MPAVIATHGLTKRYGHSRGLEDLDLTVERGEVFGFLGPNGAGKTTTIRTLLDLLHPTSGTATVFGLDSRRNSREIRSRLGNLPGEFAFEDRLTGRSLLKLLARLRGMNDLGGAEALAERFNSDLSRPLSDLSRGNRQKIGLIQALFHDPELLVLDEPTAGLDPLMQEEFLKLIEERRELGVTVFLSSHDLAEVERICDRVGIIRDGRLAAVEKVSEMRGHAYRKVEVKLRQPAATTALEHLRGVQGFKSSGLQLSFRTTDNLEPVISQLAALPVADIEVTRPTLEELFLTYYDHHPAE
jgi:ABC-2 type transport system ATP-binding protein